MGQHLMDYSRICNMPVVPLLYTRRHAADVVQRLQYKWLPRLPNACCCANDAFRLDRTVSSVKLASGWPQAGTAYTGMAGHVHASSLNAAGGHKRAHPAEPLPYSESMVPAVPAYAMPRAVPVTAPAAYALAAVSKQQLDATKHATKPGA